MKLLHIVKTVVTATCLSLASMAAGAEGATADQAVALVKKAILYVKENGKDRAFAEFNRPGGKFRDRDLYILVFDMQGVNLAHGAIPRLIGKPVAGVRDADGKVIFQAYLDTVQSKGKGWVDYRWPNPVSGKIEKKSTYVEKVDDLIVGAGIYKD